jgi:immune inhibitor A
MNEHDVHCIVMAHPTLVAKIIRTKQLFEAGEDLPEMATAELLDRRSFTLIMSRPPKTRAHTLVAPTQVFAPVVGTKKVLVKGTGPTGRFLRRGCHAKPGTL